MDYKIKQIPEDFLVEEIPRVKPEISGSYSYFWMKKRNLNTLKAVRIVSSSLRVRMDRFGWAGNKDKNAVTTQLVSIQNCSPFKEKRFEEGVELKLFGAGDERIFTGNLAGNKFKITIRNLDKGDCSIIKENFNGLKKRSLVPNFFDEQRFGGTNLSIGKALLTRDFETAAELLYRKKMENPLQAIRKVHKSNLSLYLHSYQSLIFNEMLNDYLTERCPDNAEVKGKNCSFLFPGKPVENADLPIIGFGTELKDQTILKKHGLTKRSFIIKQLPELSLEGSSRPAFVQTSNLRLTFLGEDELNQNKEKVKLEFSLPKGSYATMAVKALTAQPK